MFQPVSYCPIKDVVLPYERQGNFPSMAAVLRRQGTHTVREKAPKNHKNCGVFGKNRECTASLGETVRFF